MGLISELVVHGLRPTLTSTLSSGVKSAVSSGLGTALSHSLAPKTPTPVPPSVTPAPAPAPAPAPTQDATQGATGDTVLPELTVQGSLPTSFSAPSSLGSLLSAAAPSVIGGALGVPGTSSYDPSSQQATAPTPALANVGDNTLPELTVTGKPANDGMGVIAPLALGGGALALGAAGGGSGGAAGAADAAAPADGATVQSPATTAAEAGAAGGGLMSLLGLTPKELIGLGLLGAGTLAANGSGGSGSGGTQTQLGQIASDQKAASDMMLQRALAGQSGNIGGKGMSYIDRMVRNAQAAIRQRYAGMHMSGSTAEAADLNAAAQAGVDEQFKIGQQEATAGLSAAAALSGQSAQAYLALLNAQTAKDTQLGNSLASFAGAVATRLFKD